MSVSSIGEGVIHLSAVTMRLVGSGVLRMRVYTLDNVRTKELVGFQLSAANQFEPTRKTNFRSQRIRLRGEVNDIDEYFSISTIILWTKKVANSLPSNKNSVPTNR